jgi:hypothetical protein
MGTNQNIWIEAITCHKESKCQHTIHHILCLVKKKSPRKNRNKATHLRDNLCRILTIPVLHAIREKGDSLVHPFWQSSLAISLSYYAFSRTCFMPSWPKILLPSGRFASINFRYLFTHTFKYIPQLVLLTAEWSSDWTTMILWASLV